MDKSVQKYRQNIQNLIFTIRGKQVMLDSDLARLYQVEMRVLNQAVKRNSKRFPNHLCLNFQKKNTNI